jgi:hypothetical protein
MLFGVSEDDVQACVHVFEPSLEFGIRKLSFSNACGLGSRSGSGQSRIHDVFGYAPVPIRMRLEHVLNLLPFHRANLSSLY